ncbi:RNA polymerase sigma factor [Botrimarina colliarenosi]|uniref:RNA polymerase sigma factor n=1 Tax=Botrimarina colliarenosi TaxID=2528001 RepID=A0A5C6A0Q3_9BACT|nr:sigma-70 family RNA polymerase sigma factor [Botrimarina colliarenosi]TWT92123.1 RNA polymerase sigma factor [Botrimarina colliarenosi]
MERTNDSWLKDLTQRSEPALVELREALLRGLRRGLSGRPRADESFLEDCTQDSLLRVLDKLGQFDGRSRFVTWATAIAIRVALGQLRRSQWKDVTLADLVPATVNQGGNQLAGAPAPDVRMQRRDLLVALNASIQNDLSDRQRTALLAELRGMPQDEIARQLSCSRNALYKLTHDARKKLKARLEAAGFTGDDLIATSVA